MDCSLPHSSVHGIFQARILEPVPLPSPGIFPTQGWNLYLLDLLHWQVDYHWAAWEAMFPLLVLIVWLCPTLWSHGQQPVRLLCPRHFPGDSHVKMSELYDWILCAISVILMMECDIFSYISYITLYVIRNKEKPVLFLLDFLMIGFDFVPFFRAAICPVTSILW